MENGVPISAFNATGKLNIPNEQGCCSFENDSLQNSSTLDRINFAFCQLLYLCDEEFPPKPGSRGYEYYLMFSETLEEEGIRPNFILTSEQAKEANQSIYGMSYDFYIDSQFSAVEGQNVEIFESSENLYDFLFK